MDFLILTGFLGSGKTTLLREFLATDAAADTAVIVNEVGEIGLDGAILAEGSNGLRMAMLANGCVCCALGGDLASTVEQLLDSRDVPPRRIVLETSGISKPGPILRGLAALAWLRPRINVVATFDCLRGADVAGFEEAAAQWAGAQALVLTKRDLGTSAQRAAASAVARGLNPLAEIIDIDDPDAHLRAVFGVRPPAPIAVPDEFGLPHKRITVLLIRPTDPPTWDNFAAWLDNLSGLLGERLLRVKGVVQVADQSRRVLIQSVGTVFSAPRTFTGAIEESFLVVIARDAAADEIAGITPRLAMTVGRIGAPKPFAPRQTRSLRARPTTAAGNP